MIRVNKIDVYPERFPDHSLLLKISEELWSACDDIHYITIEWLYENDAELFTLICIKRYCDEHFSNKPVYLDLPYIPHARQDRVKTDADVFTLKYFCEVINNLHFRNILVRDAHSNVSLALLNNVCTEELESYIEDAITASGAEALFFPDEGAMKRYSNSSPLPYAFGMKRRDWATGEILGLDLINKEAIVGKNVLIIDDICSKGGTFYHSAKALKAAGAKSVSLYVTHCEGTIITGDLAASDGLVDHVYTTKSILPECLFWGSADPYWKEWITVFEE